MHKVDPGPSSQLIAWWDRRGDGKFKDRLLVNAFFARV